MQSTHSSPLSYFSGSIQTFFYTFFGIWIPIEKNQILLAILLVCIVVFHCGFELINNKSSQVPFRCSLTIQVFILLQGCLFKHFTYFPVKNLPFFINWNWYIILIKTICDFWEDSHTWWCSRSLLVEFRRPYGVLGMEASLVACKESAYLLYHSSGPLSAIFDHFWVLTEIFLSEIYCISHASIILQIKLNSRIQGTDSKDWSICFAY